MNSYLFCHKLSSMTNTVFSRLLHYLRRALLHCYLCNPIAISDSVQIGGYHDQRRCWLTSAVVSANPTQRQLMLIHDCSKHCPDLPHLSDLFSACDMEQSSLAVLLGEAWSCTSNKRRTPDFFFTSTNHASHCKTKLVCLPCNLISCPPNTCMH